MKFLLASKKYAILSICLIGLSANAQNESSNYEKALGELFAVNGSHETFVAVIDQMFDMIKQNYSSVDPGTWDELQSEFKKTSVQELVQLLAPVYQKYLTEEDLSQIVAFYSTPVGKKFANNTPQITAESMTVGQQWGLKISEKMIKRLEEKGY